MKLIVKNTFRDKNDHVTVYQPGTMLEIAEEARVANLVERGLCEKVENPEETESPESPEETENPESAGNPENADEAPKAAKPKKNSGSKGSKK